MREINRNKEITDIKIPKISINLFTVKSKILFVIFLISINNESG